MNGIAKASLGTRYLLKYIENNNDAYLSVVKNCLPEIKFWALHMVLCNNYDTLFASIPEHVISKVFTCQSIKNIHDVLDLDNMGSYSYYDYGKGYHSNIDGDYNTQLRFIRNALAHNSFTFDGKKISINYSEQDFKATFDINWLETVVKCLLSSSNYTLKKGITDHVVINLDNSGSSASDIASLVENNMLHLLKITCSMENFMVIAQKFPRLVSYKDHISFDEIKLCFLRILNSKVQEKSQSASVEDSFIETLNLLKKVYRGIFNIENVNISKSILEDPKFQELDIADGCYFLVNEYNKDDRVCENAIDLKMLLEALSSIENNESITKKGAYALNDCKFYLIRLYSHIFFVSGISNAHKSWQVLDEFADDIRVSYVHAKNVWSEYIKKISNALDTLQNANASFKVIAKWKRQLKMYEDRLKTISDPSLNNTLYRIRNSLVHDNVEIKDDNIVFYGEEPVIELPRLKKKTNEIVAVPWQNKSRTYEITIPIAKYLEIIDRMYTNNDIEISVNIAKYRQRKGYLSGKS